MMESKWRKWMSELRRWMRWDDPALPLGERGERLAARLLVRRGMKIVGENETSSLGEIDLIAVDGNTIVFVEVKTRKHHRTGSPLEAVDDRKQRQLTTLALQFMKRHGLLESPARFDVVGVTWDGGSGQPQLDYVRDAFRPGGRFQMFS